MFQHTYRRSPIEEIYNTIKLIFIWAAPPSMLKQHVSSHQLDNLPRPPPTSNAGTDYVGKSRQGHEREQAWEPPSTLEGAGAGQTGLQQIFLVNIVEACITIVQSNSESRESDRSGLDRFSILLICFIQWI